MLFDPEFYITPSEVIEKMVRPYGDRIGKTTILEPSAGSGAILDFLCKKGVNIEVTTSRGNTYTSEEKAKPERVYCLEKNPELQLILQQKGYRVLGSDFLVFQPEHRFDLIAMNPPYSDGDRHLLHAWDILQGGDIVCLLNAETVRNPFSASRKRLVAIIKEHGSVEYIGQAFLHADNPTDVEVAIVRLHKDPKEDPFRIDTDGFAAEKTPDFAEMAVSGDLPAQSSRLDAYIRCWDLTKSAAVELIKAFSRFLFFARTFINDNRETANSRADNVADSLLKDLCDMRYETSSMADVYNRFIDRAKSNAWGLIFDEIGLGKYMTTGLQRKLDEFRTAQGAASITKENIFALFRFIMANISTIMDQSVVEVYDMFTRYFDGNTSHEEGWKTNKRFKCNRKIILPNAVDAGWKPNIYGYESYFRTSYDARLDDIDKAMCWLSGTSFDKLDSLKHYGNDFRTASGPNHTIAAAITTIRVGDQDWHESAFFRIRAFKKGTIHLFFKDEGLWVLVQPDGEPGQEPNRGSRIKRTAMDKQQILSRLMDRLEKEKAAYEAAGLPEYVRLNKTRYFGAMRKQELTARKMAALETAISVLEGPFYRADVARGILLGISNQRTDKDELLLQASSCSMADRRKACQELFDSSLPILKKEILKHAT